MFSLYDFDKHVNTCSLLLSVRSVKLRSATLCTGVFLFYIKRPLMSGNEFACSLGSSSAKIAWVWTQKTRWKTLANNACRYSSRCVRAFRLTMLLQTQRRSLNMAEVKWTEDFTLHCIKGVIWWDFKSSFSLASYKLCIDKIPEVTKTNISKMYSL